MRVLALPCLLVVLTACGGMSDLSPELEAEFQADLACRLFAREYVAAEGLAMRLPRGQSELQSASVEAEQAASVDVRWEPLTEHLAALQAALLLGDGAGANAALQDVAADCAPLAASWGGAE